MASDTTPFPLGGADLGAADLELEQLRVVFDLCADAIFILDAAGRIIEVNRVACERYGYAREELLQEPIWLIYTPAERPLIPARMAKVVREGTAVFEAVHQSRDGRTIPTEVNSRFARMGSAQFFVSSCRDLTERERSEANARLTQFSVDHAATAIAWMDASGTIVYLNHTASERTSGDVRGRKMWEFDLDFSPQRWHAHWNQLKAQGSLQTEHTLVGLDGRVAWMLTTSSYLALDDRDYEVAISVDITERRQAEETLRRTAERLALHIDHTPLACIEWDEHFEVIEWNARAEQMFGWSRAEALHRKAVDLFVAPEQRERAEQRWAELWHSGGHFQGPGENLTKDGRRVHTEWYSTALRDSEGRVIGVASLVKDSTARVQAEAALRQREDVLRSTVASMDDLVFVVDKERRFDEFFQPQKAGDLYVPPEQFLGRTIDDVMPPEISAQFRRAIDTLAYTDAVQVIDYSLRLPGGERSYSAKVSRRLDAKGAYAGAVIVARDVTEQLRAAAERRELELQMQRAQKLESLGVLAGGIAHDFNNLLMVILGHVDLALLDAPPSSPVRPDLVEIDKAARRAADLSRQMLAYAGKGKFFVERVRLDKLIVDMVHMLDVAVSKKATLRLDLAPDLPSVDVDATQIRQVAMNLILNASEAIGDQPGVITVRITAIECDVTFLRTLALAGDLRAGPYVVLEVSDTGCGMDEATTARIFEPFFSTKFTGRGLGLAAVLGIVRGHRGAIEVRSKPGEGSTFRVLLPAAAPAVRAGVAAPPAASEWLGSGTILLADDEEAVRRVAGVMLEKLGFRVETAADGQEALDLFRARPSDFACVVLDVTMPRLGGGEALRAMREIRKDVPVILVSGFSEQHVLKQLGAATWSGFVQKPFLMESLRTCLRKVLEPPT